MRGSYIVAIALCISFFSLGFSYAASAKEREEFHKICNMDARGAVSLSNVNGPVTVRVWDDSRVEIKAVKTGSSEEKLRLVNIEVKEGADRVEIEAVYPKNNRNTNVSVAFELTVPRTASLVKVETVNGSIEIFGVQGRIDAETVNGSVRIEEGGGDVKAETTNGSVKAFLVRQPESVSMESTNGSLTLYLPDEINAEVDAETTNGRINSDFALNIQGKIDSKHLKGRIGTGGARFALETVNGSININRNK